MNKKEAGKLGWIASKDKRLEIYRRKRELYDKNPKICPCCNVSLEYEKRRNKFCSHRCAAIRNNSSRSKIKKKTCKNCEKVIGRNSKYYCSNSCQHSFNRKQRIKVIEKTGVLYHRDSQRKIGKKMFVEMFGHKCQICFLSKWNGKKIPLVLDHIDGNHQNNKLENIRLVCGNCDMQLSRAN